MVEPARVCPGDWGPPAEPDTNPEEMRRRSGARRAVSVHHPEGRIAIARIGCPEHLEPRVHDPKARTMHSGSRRGLEAEMESEGNPWLLRDHHSGGFKLPHGASSSRLAESPRVQAILEA